MAKGSYLPGFCIPLGQPHTSCLQWTRYSGKRKSQGGVGMKHRLSLVSSLLTMGHNTGWDHIAECGGLIRMGNSKGFLEVQTTTINLKTNSWWIQGISPILYQATLPHWSAYTTRKLCTVLLVLPCNANDPAQNISAQNQCCCMLQTSVFKWAYDKFSVFREIYRPNHRKQRLSIFPTVAPQHASIA